MLLATTISKQLNSQLTTEPVSEVIKAFDCSILDWKTVDSCRLPTKKICVWLSSILYWFLQKQSNFRLFVDINHLGEDQQTALHFACKYKKTKVMRKIATTDSNMDKIASGDGEAIVRVSHPVVYSHLQESYSQSD